MTLLRISELAERSGFPTSTLRYYERIGLVEPLGRAGNGYRVYDEAAAERLAFIARAKRLGMNLEDVATLVKAWFAGDCEPVQDQLTTFVTGRIGELRRRIADDSAFERQLERMLLRLSAGRPGPERCRPDCGCDIDPPAADIVAGAMVCSLPDIEGERRMEEWRQLIGRASRTEATAGGLRAVFDAAPEVVEQLARLCGAEIACCPFFTFTLDFAEGSVVLGIGGPTGTGDMIAALFDPARRPPDGLSSLSAPGLGR